MRIINQFVDSIYGIEIFPIISLIIFLGVFVLATIWALSLKTKDVEKMKNIPFNENQINNNDINN